MNKLFYPLLFVLHCSAISIHAIDWLTREDTDAVAADYYADLQRPATPRERAIEKRAD